MSSGSHPLAKYMASFDGKFNSIFMDTAWRELFGRTEAPPSGTALLWGSAWHASTAVTHHSVHASRVTEFLCRQRLLCTRFGVHLRSLLKTNQRPRGALLIIAIVLTRKIIIFMSFIFEHLSLIIMSLEHIVIYVIIVYYNMASANK